MNAGAYRNHADRFLGRMDPTHRHGVTPVSLFPYLDDGEYSVSSIGS